MPICNECGDRYRPEDGPCIHEHAPARGGNSYRATCGNCGREWTPGHYCIVARPPDGSMERLADQVHGPEWPYELTEEERPEAEQAAADLETCQAFADLNARLLRQGKISNLAHEMALVAFSCLSVAAEYGDARWPVAPLGGWQQKQRYMANPASFEAL